VGTIYTIGHSNRSIEAFIAMLQSFNIKVLADIRSMPGSRKWPHFNQDQLAYSLQQVDIQYMHFPDLGGRRKPKPDSHNTAWHNKAFMGYADYMETAEFKNAITQLASIAEKTPTAYMCSEAVWWRCHRSLVSDYLKVKGWTVMHIMDVSKASEHPFTSPAKPIQGDLFYN
jgi:uncharacterized protein (DUF488 family)